MKVRTIVIFSGETFDVPQGIQRIDHRATHGWQLRYGGTKLYSDHSNDGSGAAKALGSATKELYKRIAALPAPSLLQRGPSLSKTSQLPPGISGPLVRQRKGGRTRDCSLSVLIPCFGGKPRRRTIYIGTENTYTLARYEAALVRAIEMRRVAEEAYEEATTRAKRADARAHKRLARLARQP
ncbi:MAG: hypothetical protein Q8K96_04035 [Rubrivivax sp.]|nr:hypothetical protein [Rubrivivax sp.]